MQNLQILLSLVIFTPLIGAIFGVVGLAFFQRQNRIFSKIVSIASSLLSSVFAWIAVFTLKPGTAELQHRETIDWLAQLFVKYDVGLNGLNTLPLILISVVFPVLLVSQWNKKEGQNAVSGLLLLLQGTLVGAVCSQDLFLIFLFWSFTLIPLYFLISILGGKDRQKAAYRTILSSAFGNLLVFIGLILIFHSAEPHGFSLEQLARQPVKPLSFFLFGSEVSSHGLSFFLILIGFFLRIPVFPIQGWFSYLTTEIPCIVLVAMSGVFIPVSLSLLNRIALQLFQEQIKEVSVALMILGAVNIIFAALSALAQKDLIRVFGSLTLLVTGIQLIGFGSLDASAALGAMYYSLCFGLSITACGLLMGHLIESSGKSRFIDSEKSVNASFGGLIESSPLFTALTAFFFSAILCLPFTGGFVAQSLVLMGGYAVYAPAVFLSLIGFLLLLYVLFFVFRSVFLGKTTSDSVVLVLDTREKLFYFLLLLCILFLGSAPKVVIDLIQASVVHVLGVR